MMWRRVGSVDVDIIPLTGNNTYKLAVTALGVGFFTSMPVLVLVRAEVQQFLPVRGGAVLVTVGAGSCIEPPAQRVSLAIVGFLVVVVACVVVEEVAAAAPLVASASLVVDTLVCAGGVTVLLIACVVGWR